MASKCKRCGVEQTYANHEDVTCAIPEHTCSYVWRKIWYETSDKGSGYWTDINERIRYGGGLCNGSPCGVKYVKHDFDEY